MVIEVNGQNVEEKYLEDVMMLVKDGGECLSLLVVDQNGYNKMKQTQTPPIREDTEDEVKIHTYIFKNHISNVLGD